MGPKETMVFAERLYLKGYISYPRTESTSYPVHYNLLWVENGCEMEWEFLFIVKFIIKLIIITFVKLIIIIFVKLVKLIIIPRHDVEQHASNPIWGSYVRELISLGLRQPRQGVDMGDHPPITPVASVDVNNLPSGESALYEMIAKHFLSTVSDGMWTGDGINKCRNK